MLFGGVGDLLKIEQTNSEKHHNVLAHHIIPSGRSLIDIGLTFQHDDDPKHTANLQDCNKTLCIYKTGNESLQPIERPDPMANQVETHDQVLKAHLSKEVLKDNGPTIEELSKMFFTTKHRFYPIGQYRRRRINKDPPKDR
uniref:Large ribosomal subunit protein mL42 n=1 Tax=Oreochromis niloticus TaxID=8128 RepID=A0A669E2B6_ORENI